MFKTIVSRCLRIALCLVFSYLEASKLEASKTWSLSFQKKQHNAAVVMVEYAHLNYSWKGTDLNSYCLFSCWMLLNAFGCRR